MQPHDSVHALKGGQGKMIMRIVVQQILVKLRRHFWSSRESQNTDGNCNFVINFTDHVYKKRSVISPQMYFMWYRCCIWWLSHLKYGYCIIIWLKFSSSLFYCIIILIPRDINLFIWMFELRSKGQNYPCTFVNESFGTTLKKVVQKFLNIQGKEH